MRRVLVVRDALGPLQALAPVFSAAGFARPIEVENVAALLTQARDFTPELLVVPLEQLPDSALIEIEALLRERDKMAAIGTASQPDSTLILSAMRRGLSEFLVSPADPTELAAAMARFEPRWARATRAGNVTAVYSPAGGAGVSTVAVNVAHAIARRKPAGRVAVADMVVGLGDVATQLNLTPLYDLGELVHKIDRADAEALHSIMANVSDGFDALVGTSDLAIGEELNADAVQRVLSLMRGVYSHTVLDLEHTVSPRTIAALDQADRILLVFQVSVPGLRKMKRALAMFEQLDFPASKISLVANRVGGGEVLTWPDVAKALGRPVDFRLPNAYQVLAEAQTRGVPLASAGNTKDAAPLLDAYNQLASKVMAQPGVTPVDVAAISTNGKGSLGRLFGKLRK